VQARLNEQRNKHRAERATSGSLLIGRLYDDRGNRMTPSHVRKDGIKGTSNNSRFRRFVLAERAGCDARAKASPSSGTVFDAWRSTVAPLHDATRTPPVSALKRTQPPPD